MQRWLFTDPRKVGFSAAVSDRALNVGYFSVNSLDQEGTRDHRAGPTRRSPDSVVTTRGIVVVGQCSTEETTRGSDWFVPRTPPRGHPWFGREQNVHTPFKSGLSSPTLGRWEQTISLPRACVSNSTHRLSRVLPPSNAPFVADAKDLDTIKPDIGVVGAPWDDSTTNRPGARFGPRALRANAYDPGTYHLDLGIEIFDHLNVVDFGDAITSHGQWEKSKASIYERVSALTTRGIVPVILGGDHSVTWPSATAVAEAHGFGNVAMIHFDAHADTANEIEGNFASHGAMMRRLIESGAIPGDRFLQLGLRGYWPGEEDQQWMRENNLKHYMMQEFWERGAMPVLDDVIAEAQKRAPKAYISIDIDVLDPGFAPATGTPEPGGFAPIDLLRIVRRLTSGARRCRLRCDGGRSRL